MAGFEAISKYYNSKTDCYDLPSGSISRHEVERKRAKHLNDRQIIRDRIDAESAYDPYNHIGRLFRRAALRDQH